MPRHVTSAAPAKHRPNPAACLLTRRRSSPPPSAAPGLRLGTVLSGPCAAPEACDDGNHCLAGPPAELLHLHLQPHYLHLRRPPPRAHFAAASRRRWAGCPQGRGKLKYPIPSAGAGTPVPRRPRQSPTAIDSRSDISAATLARSTPPAPAPAGVAVTAACAAPSARARQTATSYLRVGSAPPLQELLCTTALICLQAPPATAALVAPPRLCGVHFELSPRPVLLLSNLSVPNPLAP